MAIHGASDDDEPFMALNMTPLIDVLLVLLIFVIMAYPLTTHSVDIEHPYVIEELGLYQDPIKNKIVITETNAVLWNGKPIDSKELIYNLKLTHSMVPTPELQFEPEANASYDTTVKVINIVKQSAARNFGIVGNEKYREFGR